MTTQQHLMTTDEAAEFPDIHPATLATWRSEGRGPRYLKVGERNVRYQQEELERWLKAQERTGTRE